MIVPTKRGELFMLDRETGELLTEVTERPVPQTDQKMNGLHRPNRFLLECRHSPIR